MFHWMTAKSDSPSAVQATMFRFLNIVSSVLSRSASLKSARRRGASASVRRMLRFGWPHPLSLTARVPIVSGTLILIVAFAVAHLMMTSVAHEQELGVRQVAAVYLDGIATTVYPHIAARNLPNTVEALRRTMWFHQGMREQRAVVRLPDGTVFADVSGPNGYAGIDDPIRDDDLRGRLVQEGGFVFDANSATGWASRAIVHEGNHIADLYVAVELKPLLKEREALRLKLLLATIIAGLGAAAVGFLIVQRMVSPVRSLTEQLRRAQAGNLEHIAPALLPPASTEYGRLLRGYNDLVDAIGEREALAAKLAQRERDSVLGRLAATVAHEVRNPLGGMSTALNTVRKFGDDASIRAKGLDLIERGLGSISDVVNSVLTFHRMPPDRRQLTGADLEDLRVLIEPELGRRRLSLTWDCQLDETVDVPATETRQIALNLLLNACEASSPGSKVGFRAQINEPDDNAGQSELFLQVMDDGQGLPPAVSAALTETGAPDQSDVPRGLGIPIIRDLVRGIGGRIAVTTGTHGKGSGIVVTFPLRSRPREEKPA